jgi:hypothetical protein
MNKLLSFINRFKKPDTQKEIDTWYGRLNVSEQTLYDFVMTSLKEEPQKWELYNQKEGALFSSDYRITVSNMEITLLTSFDPPREVMTLIDILSIKHRLLYNTYFKQYLEKSEEESKKSRLNEIQNLLTRLNREFER